jgi:hypothetical protein
MNAKALAGRTVTVARMVCVLLFAILTLGLAAPAAADCDAGCFPLGPGSAEYNKCMTGCQSGSVSGGASSGFRPPPSNAATTITGPESLAVLTERDVYVLICNDFTVNGVSAPNLRNIGRRLMNDPAYNLSPRQASQAVDNALTTTCPEYRAAWLKAVNQLGG